MPPTADARELPSLVAAVLDVVDQIRAGRVATYGDVGEPAGCGPRRVGRVLGEYGAAVPWWRVLGADGRIAAGLRTSALAALGAEGVRLCGDRVDLRVSRWTGPAPSAESAAP